MNGTKILICASLFLSPLTSSYADATTGTGNELQTVCTESNSQSNNWSWSYCVAFVDGALVGFKGGATIALILNDPKHDASAAINRFNAQFKFCIPENVTRNQRALVVAKYLRDHPESLNQPDYVLVIGAIVNAWPCPQSSK